jgi:dTDP-4-amino-4,6-dideoxygalactose transaminase
MVRWSGSICRRLAGFSSVATLLRPAPRIGFPLHSACTMTVRAPWQDYRFPLVRPALPEPSEWLPFLEDSYRTRWFSNFGPASTQLERELAETFGAPGEAFVLTSSATAGLAACLIAARAAGPVLVPAFTFPATFAAVRMAGLEPILIDVDEGSWASSPEQVAKALNDTGADAVILIAPFGIEQDFSGQIAACRARNAVVVIDNAAGLGGGVWHRSSCRGGVFEVYSLHATKPFAIGEGGAIRAAEAMVPALRSASNFGLPWQPHDEPRWGINGKMTEIAAAIGLAVLRNYRNVVTARRAQAKRYIGLLDRFHGIAIHRDIADAPWQVFPCLLPSPEVTENFVAEAARRGVEVRRYYRPSLADWGGLRTVDRCATSRYLAERMVCLPVYSRISAAEIRELHGVVARCLEHAITVYAEPVAAQ